MTPGISGPKNQPKFLIPAVLVGVVLSILIYYFVSSYFNNFTAKPPPPKPVVQNIPGWQTFSNPNFGVSFQYPPNGHPYVGTQQVTKNPEVQIDLQTKCQDGTPSLFSVVRSENPPDANISRLLMEEVKVNGISGLGSGNSNSGGERISVKNNNFYYLLVFITCDPSINQQILSTFQFTD